MTLVVPRIMIDNYGSEQNGLVVSISQIVAMFLVVEAGLTNASMVALYKPLAKRDFSVVNGLMQAIERLFRPVALAFGLLVLSLSIIYPIVVGVSSLAAIEVSLIVLVLGVNGIADFLFFAKYRVLLNAAQRSFIVSQASIVYVLLNGLIIAVAAWGGLSLLEGRAVAALAIVGKIFLLRHHGRKLVPSCDEVERQDKPKIPNRGDVLFQQILGAVQVGTPALLATGFTSLNDVSVLSMYLIVSQGLINIVSIASSAATAGFGHLFASSKLDSLRRAHFDLEFVFSYGVGIVFGVSIFLITPFVGLYVGGLDDVDYVDATLGLLVCVNAWLYAIKAPGGTLIISAGHFRQTRYRVLIQGLLLIVGGVILAPPFGLYGIMIASIISNLYRVMDLAIYVPKRILETSLWQTFSRTAQSFLILTGLGLGGVFIIPTITSWLAFVVMGIVGLLGGSVLAFAVALLFERSALRTVWRRVSDR